MNEHKPNHRPKLSREQIEQLQRLLDGTPEISRKEDPMWKRISERLPSDHDFLATRLGLTPEQLHVTMRTYASRGWVDCSYDEDYGYSWYELPEDEAA